MRRLDDTYIGPWSKGDAFVGKPDPEDSELAEKLKSDFEEQGLRLKTSIRPYGGGFAQGWEQHFALLNPLSPTESFGVLPMLAELSAMHESDGRPDMTRVYSVAGHLAIAVGMQNK